MNFRPGDTVRLPDKSKDCHYVYSLVDDGGKAFYIGKTCDPNGRLRSHWVGRFNPRVRAKIRTLKDPRLLILSDPVSETEALALEAQLIAETPDLLNQEHREDYRTLHGKNPLIQKFCRAASKG